MKESTPAAGIERSKELSNRFIDDFPEDNYLNKHDTADLKPFTDGIPTPVTNLDKHTQIKDQSKVTLDNIAEAPLESSNAKPSTSKASVINQPVSEVQSFKASNTKQKSLRVAPEKQTVQKESPSA